MIEQICDDLIQAYNVQWAFFNEPTIDVYDKVMYYMAKGCYDCKEVCYDGK